MEAAGIESPEAEAAALSLGKAVGITNLLRGTLHHAERWEEGWRPGRGGRRAGGQGVVGGGLEARGWR